MKGTSSRGSLLFYIRKDIFHIEIAFRNSKFNKEKDSEKWLILNHLTLLNKGFWEVSEFCAHRHILEGSKMITMILFLGIGGYVLAVLLGLHELTIEGAKKRQYGWGRGNMNTSIILKPRNWFLRFFQTVVLLGRPVTEYHIWLNLMLIFGMHVIVIGAIVLSGSYWSWAREVYLWGLYFLWCAVWDYSWFVFSPAYGVKEFKSQDIWWHQRKFKGPVMLDYLEAIISSIVLAVISRYLLGGEVSMINHFAVMACWAILTVVSPYLFVPLYHKVFRYMWLNDEREQLEQMLQQKEK